MRRREFVTLFGGAAAAWPVAARAQQPAIPVIGIINAGFPETSVSRVAGFRQGLNEMGYVENASGPTPFSSSLTASSTADAFNLQCWRYATPWLRHIQCATMSTLAGS